MISLWHCANRCWSSPKPSSRVCLPSAGCPARLGKGHRAAFPQGPEVKQPRTPTWKRKVWGEITTEFKKIKSGLNWEKRFTVSSKSVQAETNTACSESPEEGFAAGGGLLICGAPGPRTLQNKNLALNLEIWLSKTVWRKKSQKASHPRETWPPAQQALEPEAAAVPVPGLSHWLSSSYTRPHGTGQWWLQEMGEPDQGCGVGMDTVQPTSGTTLEKRGFVYAILWDFQHCPARVKLCYLCALLQSFNPQHHLSQVFGLKVSVELQLPELLAPSLFLIKELLLGCRQQKIVFRCCCYSQQGVIETHYHSQV